MKRQENTQAVRALWKETMRKPWPNEVRETLSCGPKERQRNPDIVAYHEKRNEWRFCEVKREDRVDPYQIQALAILHLLTGAPVALVHLVPNDRSAKRRRHRAEIAYKGTVPPDWILPSFVEGTM